MTSFCPFSEGKVQPSGTLRAIWPCSIAAPMPVLHRATNAHTMYMRARMYNPVTLPALTAARRSPPYLRGGASTQGLVPSCRQLVTLVPNDAARGSHQQRHDAREDSFNFREFYGQTFPDWSEGQNSPGPLDLKTPCIYAICCQDDMRRSVQFTLLLGCIYSKYKIRPYLCTVVVSI